MSRVILPSCRNLITQVTQQIKRRNYGVSGKLNFRFIRRVSLNVADEIHISFMFLFRVKENGI
jgi:hypothetical protein